MSLLDHALHDFIFDVITSVWLMDFKLEIKMCRRVLFEESLQDSILSSVSSARFVPNKKSNFLCYVRCLVLKKVTLMPKENVIGSGIFSS